MPVPRRIEAWFATQPALRYRRTAAGAIAFAEADLPITTRELVERVRQEQSVLLVPGEMFGIDNGIRVGFGYHVDETLDALALGLNASFAGLVGVAERPSA